MYAFDISTFYVLDKPSFDLHEPCVSDCLLSDWLSYWRGQVSQKTVQWFNVQRATDMCALNLNHGSKTGEHYQVRLFLFRLGWRLPHYDARRDCQADNRRPQGLWSDRLSSVGISFFSKVEMKESLTTTFDSTSVNDAVAQHPITSIWKKIPYVKPNSRQG